MMKGIRGAASVAENTPQAILAATRTLLAEIMQRNNLQPQEVVSALFTLTPDLNAAFPAAAARQLGWRDVPLLCAQEIAVPGAPPRIVRVLLHVDRNEIVHHVYLGEAAKLRPDLAEKGEDQWSSS
jgi:chorismate mutase